MIPFQQCTIVFVCGPVRSGKTHVINEWEKKENRVVRFDATGETVVDAGLEHIWKSPKQLHERLKKNPYYFRIAYHPGVNLRLDFDWCSKVLWRVDVHKVLICDEFHEVCGVNDTPEWVQTILRYARHAHMGIIAASQRIADVHKLFTSGCHTIVLFQTSEARDLDAIEDRWKCADMVERLRKLDYNDVTKKTAVIPQCVVKMMGQKPRVWDFKLNRFVDSVTALPQKRRAEPTIADDVEPDLSPPAPPASENEEIEID